MGASQIKDKELAELGVEIVDRTDSGSRMLKIPEVQIDSYL